MKDFQRPKPWILPAIIFSLCAVFAVDWLTPIGMTVWVFYMIPVVLTFYEARPWVPIATAVAGTALIYLGLFLSPGTISDSAQYYAVYNRSFKVVSLWIVAILAVRFIRARLEIAREQWLSRNLARLREVLSGDKDEEKLGAAGLELLAGALGAQVGAVYATLDHQTIRRVAGLALSPEDFAKKSTLFRFGESLVGKTALKRELEHLREVPANYLKISSGLGEASLKELVVAPLVINGQAKGVIELGFLQQLQPEIDLELLRRISEPFATVLQSAEYRRRQNELLEETLRKSEQLQVQQEELRVNNEELEEQARALKEAQARLESQQAELEQTNSQLEEQAQILETQKDALDSKNLELERKSQSLELASRYKSEFLANMSHELRTPLNSSLILAKLLADNKEKNLSPQQVEYAQTIYSSGNDLLSLINDVLDLSKVEAGRVELRPERFSLSSLIEGLEKMFAPVAQERRVELKTDVSPDAPSRIFTDRLRLEQVLKNFLSNAFKFTHEGSVALQVQPATDSSHVAITVQDTGIGIPKEQHHLIFEAFKQADGTTSRKYGGTGLGLSISRELARLLGGEIVMESEPGKGSRFTLLLPIEFQAQELSAARPTANSTPATKIGAAPRASAPTRAKSREQVPLDDDREKIQPSDRRVLIIEDDPTFRKILVDLAHARGYKCLAADTAADGLELARKWQPSAVLLDVKLPDQSGLAVLDSLKQDLRSRHIPVHVVSGADFTRPALDMGAAGFLLKPVQADQLAKTFSDIESRMQKKLKRVLIIEDDPTQQMSMKALIAAEDIEIELAGTKKEAIEKLHSQSWDCVILDLSLSDGSGYQLLEEFCPPSEACPPVIVYTGRDLSFEEEARLRQVSQSIIIKGANSPERLLDEVTLFLHQVESEMPLERRQMLQSLKNRDQTIEGKTILVVDDDVRNIFALTAALETEGAKVEIARNGVEAIRKLESGTHIDLVLMDIMMPEMDGYEATRRIRGMKGFERLPIIAVTAKAMRDDQDRCIEAGANDYLPKPIDLNKLTNLVRIWLPRSQRRWL